MDKIKDRLAEAMRVRGMKATDLCKKADIPKSSLSLYLSGKYEPKSDRLYSISKALGISEAWLLGYDDAPMDRQPDQLARDELAEAVAILKAQKELRPLIIKISNLSQKDKSAVESLVDALSRD